MTLSVKIMKDIELIGSDYGGCNEIDRWSGEMRMRSASSELSQSAVGCYYANTHTMKARKFVTCDSTTQIEWG